MKQIIFALIVGFGLGAFVEGKRMQSKYRQAIANNICLDTKPTDLAIKYETVNGTHTVVCSNGARGEGCILDSESKPNKE